MRCFYCDAISFRHSVLGQPPSFPVSVRCSDDELRTRYVPITSASVVGTLFDGFFDFFPGIVSLNVCQNDPSMAGAEKTGEIIRIFILGTDNFYIFNQRNHAQIFLLYFVSLITNNLPA